MKMTVHHRIRNPLESPPPRILVEMAEELGEQAALILAEHGLATSREVRLHLRRLHVMLLDSDHAGSLWERISRRWPKGFQTPPEKDRSPATEHFGLAFHGGRRPKGSTGPRIVVFLPRLVEAAENADQFLNLFALTLAYNIAWLHLDRALPPAPAINRSFRMYVQRSSATHLALHILKMPAITVSQHREPMPGFPDELPDVPDEWSTLRARHRLRTSPPPKITRAPRKSLADHMAQVVLLPIRGILAPLVLARGLARWLRRELPPMLGDVSATLTRPARNLGRALVSKPPVGADSRHAVCRAMRRQRLQFECKTWRQPLAPAHFRCIDGVIPPEIAPARPQLPLPGLQKRMHPLVAFMVAIVALPITAPVIILRSIDLRLVLEVIASPLVILFESILEAGRRSPLEVLLGLFIGLIRMVLVLLDSLRALSAWAFNLAIAGIRHLALIGREVKERFGERFSKHVNAKVSRLGQGWRPDTPAIERYVRAREFCRLQPPASALGHFTFCWYDSLPFFEGGFLGAFRNGCMPVHFRLKRGQFVDWIGVVHQLTPAFIDETVVLVDTGQQEQPGTPELDDPSRNRLLTCRDVFEKATRALFQQHRLSPGAVRLPQLTKSDEWNYRWFATHVHGGNPSWTHWTEDQPTPDGGPISQSDRKTGRAWELALATLHRLAHVDPRPVEETPNRINVGKWLA